MKPRRSCLIGALLVSLPFSALVAQDHPSDEMFALAFNDSVRAALPPTAPFTSDVGILQDGLTNTIRAHDRTALFDVLTAGLHYFGGGRQRSGYLAGLPKAAEGRRWALRLAYGGCGSNKG